VIEQEKPTVDVSTVYQ